MNFSLGFSEFKFVGVEGTVQNRVSEGSCSSVMWRTLSLKMDIYQKMFVFFVKRSHLHASTKVLL